jgi:Bax protein
MIIKTLLILVIFLNIIKADGLSDEYYKITNTAKMKNEFFSFIKKMAILENTYILADRQYIKNNFDKNTTRMNLIKKRYSIKDNAKLEDYLYTIDIIPTSMVITQAALESGWGKSRFFKKAKNIFGQWTWSGKGLTPSGRDPGKKHKIAIFPTYQKSVNAYMINLNKSWAYKKLRELRSKQRALNQKILGSVLADGLVNYSQKKEAYVKSVKNFIRQNKLYKYDNI